MKKKTVTPLLYGLSAVIVLMTAVLLFSSAFARYKNRSDVRFNMQSASGQVSIQAQDGWTSENGGTRTLSFAVVNTKDGAFCAYDQTVRLRAFVGIGIKTPENITLTLTVGDKTYTGQAEAIAPGSADYMTYGEGFSYRFFSGGEEFSATLLGGRDSAVQATLVCEGTSVYPAAVQMIAVGEIE